MDYNSIEEIFAADTTNMEVLREDQMLTGNSKITVTGVSWFTFNGLAASNIYISAYSSIGFTSSSEHIKVNYRTSGGLVSLYREEGTLYGYYKFLKIRWRGRSRYNYSSAAYALEYDVILWDTGDISIHMVSIPTSYTGTYSLTASSTYTYTVSAASTDVTFIKSDSGFEVNNSIIEIIDANSRYLVRSGSTYYTVVDNTLSQIEVSELTSSVFLNSGTFSIPSISLLSDLANPEILYFYNGEKELEKGLAITGTPPLPQILNFEAQDMSGHSGIERVDVFVSGDVKFTITFDDGATWKYYNGSTWVVAITENEGMTVNMLRSVTPNIWSEVATSTTFRFRCALMTLQSTASQMYIKYN